jgi:hypothetical protein
VEGNNTSAVDKWGRVRARLREQLGEDYITPFPGVDVWRGYDFPLVTAEQMRALRRPEARWTRPAMSLEEFLRRRAR